MLYPKEDLNNKKLMYACRTCQFSEEATSSCVFRNNLYNTVGETAGVTQDVGSDPTVGLPDFCTYCGQPIICLFCPKVHHSDINSLCNHLLAKLMRSDGNLLEELALFEAEEDSMEMEATEEDEGDETNDQQPVQLQPLLEIQHA